MSREGQLMKNTIIITIGKICTQFVSFFLLPLYTSLLTTEEYGIVDILNTYITLLIPLITLQIEQATFRYLIDIREKKDDDEKKKIISSAMIFVMIMVLVFLLFFLLFAKYINIPFKYFFISNLLSCMFSSILLQITRGVGDNKTYAIGSLITAITMIILNVILIAGLAKGVSGLLISNFCSNLFCCFYLVIKKKVYKYVSIKYFEKEYLKKLLKYSTPLIPNNLSWWIINVFDRTIITLILGAGLNGVYSIANKFSNMYIIIYNIFNMTWTESASLAIDDEDKDSFFSKIINIALQIFVGSCLLIIAVIPFVFPILVNNSFNEAYNQIPILMLATLFNVMVGLISTVYIAKKITNKVAKTSMIAALINVIINIFFIKFWGLYAASISTAISYFSMMILRYFEVQKYVNITINKSLIISSIIMLCILFVTYYLNNINLNILMFIFVIIYAIIINRKNINFIINVIKLKKLKGDKND